ncbi:L-serine ammonia-lyase [Alcaligenaceae bacterium SJ-26]|nr:L-serine ammonia-lyase [Alcaligenaceae bacterium SJ-26]
MSFISVLDLFKIGLGPSSSHTTGPMLAGLTFLSALTQAGHAREQVRRLEIRLYGSLSATGIGHATDRAVVAGLCGFDPATADPDQMQATLDTVRQDGSLPLGGVHAVPFEWSRDLRLLPVSLPYHPNALRITAYGEGAVLLEKTYYSTGGGFITDADSLHDGAQEDDGPDIPYPFASTRELLALCEQHDLDIAGIMMTNENALRPEAETRAALLARWQVMQACVARGLRKDGILPGGLEVPRRAPGLYRKLLASEAGSGQDGRHATLFGEMDWVNLYALAVNEENASGGRVVTAPTNGASGIIPAVLHFHVRHHPDCPPDDIVRFLLTAGAVGSLCKRNASISGAEVGCQGEVGVACAMASAGLAALMGGTPQQVENAAEIGLEHNLGLTCDPVGGLVQVPCIERNAIASVKAINAARMALHGDGRHLISLDQAIRTLRDTGRDMLTKYKETSEGGLAVSYVEC